MMTTSNASPVTMITVANFAKDGSEALQRYVAGTLPLLEAAGAKVLRFGGVEAFVGEEVFDLVAVMEFESDRAMRQFLESPAYTAMHPDRDQAFQLIRTFRAVAV